MINTDTFLEAINAFMLIITLWVSLTFMDNILTQHGVIGALRRCWNYLKGKRENTPETYLFEAKVSIMVLMTGETIRAGTIWYWRSFDSSVYGMLSTKMVFFGALLIGIGGICMVRVFSPRHTKVNWQWMACGMLAILFAGTAFI